MSFKLYTYDIPKDWDELVSLKSKIRQSAPEMDRLPDDLSFYRLYTKLVPSEIRLQIIDQMIGDCDYKILKNNFPYLRLIQNIPGVTHYCLWSRIGKLSSKIVESEIAKNFPHKKYFWFENHPKTKSIPEIWHCQIFVKEK